MTDDPHARYVRQEEDAGERLDRQWNELLQELRLAQAGTQILFAFLLTIAFSNRFPSADQFTHDVFVGTLVASALAVGLFLAPVSFHRILFQKKMRDRMIPIAGRMAAGGLFFLILATAGGILIAVDVVLPRKAALIVVGFVVAWFVVFWYAVPLWVRHASRAAGR
ncbi:MAG TPA: DUF6328 family protein [Kribbella sp.]